MTEEATRAKVRLSDQLGLAAEARRLAAAIDPLRRKAAADHLTVGCAARALDAQADEIERLTKYATHCDELIAAYKATAAPEQLGMPVATYEASSSVQLVACRQRDGSCLWAVRDSCGSVLNKLGEWEYEPLPSSRGAEFLERCRYTTPLEARDAYMRDLKA